MTSSMAEPFVRMKVVRSFSRDQLIEIINNQRRQGHRHHLYNLKVTVKRLRRKISYIIQDQVTYEIEDIGRCSFIIPPSTYSDMNSLITTLHRVFVEKLRLELGRSDIVTVAELFNDYMMMMNSVYCDYERGTVVVAEFDSKELFEFFFGVREEADKEVVRLRMSKMQVEAGTSTCAICLDEFANEVAVVKTSCAHLFHYMCLRNWLSKNKKNGCPMCRAHIRATN